MTTLLRCSCGWKYHPEDPNALRHVDHHQARCDGDMSGPVAKQAECTGPHADGKTCPVHGKGADR